MKLPSVTTTMTVLAIIWGTTGVAAHGLAILAYPLAWLALCVFFLALNKAFDVVQAATTEPVSVRPKVAPRPAVAAVPEEVSAA